MVIIGMVLAGVDLRAVVRLPGIWKVIALRLVGYPLAVLCLLKFSGIASLVPGGADILLISLLAACAPSGTMVIPAGPGLRRRQRVCRGRQRALHPGVHRHHAAAGGPLSALTVRPPAWYCGADFLP